MEYCPNGNLREFLQNSCSRLNLANDYLSSDLSKEFGQKNLIYLAWQIAKGMEFLISRKVIKIICCKNCLWKEYIKLNGKDLYAKRRWNKNFNC